MRAFTGLTNGNKQIAPGPRGAVLIGLCSDRSARRHFYIAAAFFLAIVAALSGCRDPGRSASEAEQVLEPELIKVYSGSAWMWAGDPAHAISPDGQWTVVVSQSGGSNRLLALPLIPADGDDPGSEVTLDRADVPAGPGGPGLQFVPIGWLSDSTYVYLALGNQDRGGQRLEQGIAVMRVAAPSDSGSAEGTGSHSGAPKPGEVAFIPATWTYFCHADLFRDPDFLVINVAGALWRVDVSTGTAKLVKSQVHGAFDSVSTPALSPDGSQCAYRDNTDGAGGIYLLDLSTGTERLVLKDTDRAHLSPSWSPDGRYLALYAVDRRPDATGFDLKDYDFFTHEDAILPMGSAIRVVDLDGKAIKEVAGGEDPLSGLAWSPDSKAFGYLTWRHIPLGSVPGSYAPERGVGGAKFSPDAVMICPVSRGRTAAKVGSVPGLGGPDTDGELLAYVIGFDTASKGIFYQTLECGEWIVWYGAPGKTGIQAEKGKPVIVAGGLWQGENRRAVFAGSGGSHLATVIGLSGDLNLYLVGPTGIWRSDVYETVTAEIVGHDMETLMVMTMDDDGIYNILVYRMRKPAKRVISGW